MRGLQPMYDGLINLERLGQNIIVYRRIRPEYSVGNDNNTRALAAQKRHRHGISMPHVLLKMNQPEWKRKHISLVKYFRDQPVFWARCHEPHEHGPLQDRQQLCRAWVAVRWDHPSGGVVDSHCGDAEGVEAWNLVHGWPVHEGAQRVRCVSRNVEPFEEEMVCCYLLRVHARKSIHSHCGTRIQFTFYKIMHAVQNFYNSYILQTSWIALYSIIYRLESKLLVEEEILKHRNTKNKKNIINHKTKLRNICMIHTNYLYY